MSISSVTRKLTHFSRWLLHCCVLEIGPSLDFCIWLDDGCFVITCTSGGSGGLCIALDDGLGFYNMCIQTNQHFDQEDNQENSVRYNNNSLFYMRGICGMCTQISPYFDVQNKRENIYTNSMQMTFDMLDIP